MSQREALLEQDAEQVQRLFKERRGRNIIVEVCSSILATEFSERLAFYGLTGSLTIYFHKNLGLSSVMATELNSLFSAVNYLTPLLGAFVADVYLGRYKTIRSFCFLYLIGMFLCVFSAYPSHEVSWLFMLGLYGGVAFGAGGIKPNVVVIGADQFDPADPDQVKQKESFFNYFYWSINLGATFSYGYLPYLAVNGSPQIPEKDGFFASFLIPACAFVLAYLFFLSGSKRYIKKPPQGSALSVFLGILNEAGRKSRIGRRVLFGAFLQIPAVIIVIISYFVTNADVSQGLAIAGMTMIVFGVLLVIKYGQETEWLEGAMSVHAGSYTENEVRDAGEVMRLFPYLGFIILFWAVYGQMNGNFVNQGCQMDLIVGDLTLSSAMLSVFDSTVILVFIPVFDRVIYPTFARLGYPLSLMQKLGGGFIFCALSMICAGFVEIERKRAPLMDVNSNCAESGETLYMSDFSIFWQTPQFLLIGIGEIMTSISSYELFYSQVPESMRSVCQSLNLLTTTLGFMCTGAVNSIFASYLPANLNNGHLEVVFFFMAGLMILNLFGYIHVSQSFVYKEEIITETGEKVRIASTSSAGSVNQALRHDSFSSGEAAPRRLSRDLLP